MMLKYKCLYVPLPFFYHVQLHRRDPSCMNYDDVYHGDGNHPIHYRQGARNNSKKDIKKQIVATEM